MKLLSTLATMALTTGVATFALPALSTEVPAGEFRLAQNSRAENTCVQAVRDEGYRVEDILSSNPFSGGVEVIMEVSRQSETLTVGCDYSNSTREVELYRLDDDQYLYEEDQNGDEYGYDDNDWRSQFYTPDGVGDRGYAEDIARELVSEQLGIDDPYSDVVDIDEVQRTQEDGDRVWRVEGSANGAPFEVLIRDNDAYILEFNVY